MSPGHGFDATSKSILPLVAVHLEFGSVRHLFSMVDAGAFCGLDTLVVVQEVSIFALALGLAFVGALLRQDQVEARAGPRAGGSTLCVLHTLGASLGCKRKQEYYPWGETK